MEHVASTENHRLATTSHWLTLSDKVVSSTIKGGSGNNHRFYRLTIQLPYDFGLDCPSIVSIQQDSTTYVCEHLINRLGSILRRVEYGIPSS